MTNEFVIENINIGNPNEDYNITWFSTQSEYGDLKDWATLTKLFSAALNTYLSKHPTFSLYDNFFQSLEKLKYINIAFSSTEFNLIDRYISLYSKPNFSKMLLFLQQVYCSESWTKIDTYWFWKIVCINYKKMEPSEILAQILKESLLNKDKPCKDWSQQKYPKKNDYYRKNRHSRTDIL